MNVQLKNQVALVTGASRGIGRAIFRELGQCGAVVIGTATAEPGLAAIRKELEDRELEGAAYALDVSNAESVSAFADSLKKDGRTPGILVNNAGITRDNLLLRMKDEEWETVIETDLNSIFRLTRIVLRDMIKARYGRIINIASVVGLSGNPGQANYAAAKAGIIGFTKSLAQEIGGRGVTVNAVAPGMIETDMTDALSDDQRRQIIERIPLARLGSSDEIASVVAFLASPYAGYITGETINVNGGMYMA